MSRMRVTFHVETNPAAKPVGPWKPRSTGVLRYLAYKKIIQLRANAVFPKPLVGAFVLSIRFGLAVPDSWDPAKRRGALDGKIKHTSKPDLKNLIAGVEDALTGIAWHDDAAVVGYDWPMRKEYSQVPGTSITVRLLAPENIWECPA